MYDIVKYRSKRTGNENLLHAGYYQNEHTPKRPRRHNFWSLTTSLSLAVADGEGAVFAILATVGGFVGLAACCRAVIVRWMHANIADTATGTHEDSESESDFGSTPTFVSFEDDSSEDSSKQGRFVHVGGVPLTCASCIFGYSFYGIVCVKTPEPNLEWESV